MNDDLEQRLRAYGSAIDAATAEDLALRGELVVEVSAEPLDHRSRRSVMVLAVLAIAAVATVGIVTITHRPSAKVEAPGSRSPSRSDCSSAALTRAQQISCLLASQASTSDLGSGVDGNPTPAQAATLATELQQYDPAEVQKIRRAAEANGNHPSDQALVEVLEFRNACRHVKVAAVAAESARPDQVASVVNGIMVPEIARLRARTVADDEGYMVFDDLVQRLIAGQAPAVLQGMGKTICPYAI